MSDDHEEDSIPEDVKRAWEIVMNVRMPAGPTLGAPLSDQEIRLEGMAHATGNCGARIGGVATVKCPDGAEWVIDYDEQSPYHAFAARPVVVTGRSCEPPLQHRVCVTGHLGVLSMQLAEDDDDAWLIEVGPGHFLSGRFDEATCASGTSALSFVTAAGDTFLVANNPAGATLGCTVDAYVYAVQLSPNLARPAQRYLWVICPCSCAEFGALRSRPNAGLPPDVFVDTASGQIRNRSVLVPRQARGFSESGSAQ